MAARPLAAAAGVTALAVALLAGAVQLQAARERAYPAPASDASSLYIRSGVTLRRVAGPYTGVAADAYWIRVIQYYGGTKRQLAALQRGVAAAPPPAAASGADDYVLLYPLLDITTTLDPRFNIAYRFGAVFLAEPHPRGAGRPELAIALLEKGLRARPDKWEYLQDIGFVHYWYRHDYTAAAARFQQASEMPGAPWWLRSLAATTLAQGGDRRSSRAMWEAIRQSAEIDWLRQDADRRLAQLRALDDIDALQRTVDDVSRRGEAPASWMALVRARVIAGVPVDPSGTPYELTGGRVTLSESSSLSPLPIEPQRLDTRPSA